jgi:hypothetical protein
MSVPDERKQQIAADAGIAAWWPELHGGNDEQVRQHAVRIRERVMAEVPAGAGYSSPQAALAAMFADRARRNARMRWQ